MRNETTEKMEDAINVCLTQVIDGDSEQSSQNLKTAIEGYKCLKEADKELEEKNNVKKKILAWFGGILAVVIPAVTVEVMQERFMDKQANKAYEFEKTGTVTSLPGKNFVNGLFKSRKVK